MERALHTVHSIPINVHIVIFKATVFPSLKSQAPPPQPLEALSPTLPPLTLRSWLLSIWG